VTPLTIDEEKEALMGIGDVPRPPVMDSARSFGKLLVISTRSGNAIWLTGVNSKDEKRSQKST
jgi:hypothetical protein